MIFCRISLPKVLKMPGVKEMVEVVSQLTRSKCGVSLVQEALEEVGVVQYLAHLPNTAQNQEDSLRSDNAMHGIHLELFLPACPQYLEEKQRECLTGQLWVW